MANVTNSDAELDGKTLVTAEDNQDVDGLKTFARSPSAPFAVEAGSAVVPNLDAALLEGQGMAFYRNSGNQNAGLLPDERIRDPLPVRSGQNLYNLPAANLVGALPPALLPQWEWKVLADTGTINNWDVGLGSGKPLFVFWTGTSLTQITGIKAGVEGQLLTIQSYASGILNFANMSAASLATSRLQNLITSAPTPIAPLGGCVQYVYLNGVWRLVTHEQGAWIDAGFNVAQFWPGMTAAMVITNRYRVKGRSMEWQMQLGNAVPPAAPTPYLHIINPHGFTMGAGACFCPIAYLADPGPATGYVVWSGAGGSLASTKTAGGNWGTPIALQWTVTAIVI